MSRYLNKVNILFILLTMCKGLNYKKYVYLFYLQESYLVSGIMSPSFVLLIYSFSSSPNLNRESRLMHTHNEEMIKISL